MAIVVIASCKKPTICENCEPVNKLPMADAGKDTIIVSPGDSILLDGSASHDRDGRIVNYEWSQVGGFSAVAFGSVNTVKTNIGHFGFGIYQFQLAVTDDQGAYSVDTVTVQIEDRVYPVHPIGFYPNEYTGLVWNTGVIGLVSVGPVPDWQFSDFSEDNDGSKWKVQLIQQSPNVVVSLPYVQYSDVLANRNSPPLFYSIKDATPVFPGENPVGPVYIFADPAKTTKIDFTHTVDVVVYVKF